MGTGARGKLSQMELEPEEVEPTGKLSQREVEPTGKLSQHDGKAMEIFFFFNRHLIYTTKTTIHQQSQLNKGDHPCKM